MSAPVNFLFEYRNMNAESYLTSRTRSNVSSKSSSVSPGKPTIISVVIARSGIKLLIFDFI